MYAAVSNNAEWNSKYTAFSFTSDASGNVLENNRVFPFGEPWVTPVASANKEAFTTYQRDDASGEAGLDYATARYYASRSGRFMTPDPGHVGTNVGDPQSWNAYAYVGNYTPARRSKTNFVLSPSKSPIYLNLEAFDGSVSSTAIIVFHEIWHNNGGGDRVDQDKKGTTFFPFHPVLRTACGGGDGIQ